MNVCAHDFERSWRCLHTARNHHELCTNGNWVYRCLLCGEPGYALRDGVEIHVVKAADPSQARG